MALLWFYFTFAEYLTTYYGGEPTHMAIFLSKTEGRFSPFFWTMVVTCFVIPFAHAREQPDARNRLGNA